jgi:hypothetical protein
MIAELLEGLEGEIFKQRVAGSTCFLTCTRRKCSIY